jgi:hypothetical protein
MIALAVSARPLGKCLPRHVLHREVGTGCRLGAKWRVVVEASDSAHPGRERAYLPS